jgi:hypothetical protein
LLTTKSGYVFAGMDYYGLYRSVNKIITDVEVTEMKPVHYSLNQNYPNPFNPTTKISYSLPIDSKVNVSIYNILGQKVYELVNKSLKAGEYEAVFNASNFSSGVYIYRIKTDNFVQSKKMLLLK